MDEQVKPRPIALSSPEAQKRKPILSPNFQTAREWRIYYGHSVHSYDHTSGSSLVSKVCKGQPLRNLTWRFMGSYKWGYE